MMASLRDGYRAAVFGAAGGIGAALCEHLLADPRCAELHAAARREPAASDPRLRWLPFDLLDEASIARAADSMTGEGPLDLVVIATGILHAGSLRPEKSWRALDAEAFARVFAINTTGPALIAKHTLDRLNRDSRSVFAALSARVGSISDNGLGGWHAYRASKAALNMLIRNFAIELAVRNPRAVCAALHPGTVETPLSAPFRSGVSPEKLFEPAKSAAHLLTVLDGLQPAQSGRLFAWDGAEIQP